VRIEWQSIADRDRDNQIAYISERNPRAALHMSDLIDEATTRLIDHPKMGRPGRVRGTRELVVAGTPYLVIYRVEAAAVSILRLVHGAQRWPAKR
jgi:toxin ParE1/3/4